MSSQNEGPVSALPTKFLTILSPKVEGTYFGGHPNQLSTGRARPVSASIWPPSDGFAFLTISLTTLSGSLVGLSLATLLPVSDVTDDPDATSPTALPFAALAGALWVFSHSSRDIVDVSDPAATAVFNVANNKMKELAMTVAEVIILPPR
jgi:hypothetical protein